MRKAGIVFSGKHPNMLSSEGLSPLDLGSSCDLSAPVFSVVKWRGWLTNPSSPLDLLCCDLGVQNISLTTLVTEALGSLSGMPYIAQKAELWAQKWYIETVFTQKTKWESGEWHNHSSYRVLHFTQIFIYSLIYLFISYPLKLIICCFKKI